MNKPTGGPAFPTPEIPPRVVVEASGGATHFPHIPARNGMTLRDYFAAKAPPPPDDWFDTLSCEGTLVSCERAVAIWNFRYADAMLVERDR